MPRIEEMYAFIVEDNGPDDEGVIGIQAISREHAPIWLPLVGADMARVDSLRPLAEDIGRQIGKKVTLVHFSNRQDLEVIR
ncbi:unnamed protein product [marine sediment metagenome]|uniref:Uncharacterized protein n=1 Tax=marine sediment metagenome TaxID=412755 RepID=X1Q636_9ZZZZ